MGCRVVLARAAERDRDETVEYMIDILGSRAAAAGFLDDLDALFANLERFPHMYPESAESRLARMGYRKAPIGGYVALYRLRGDEVQVARIFHQRQDYARLV